LFLFAFQTSAIWWLFFHTTGHMEYSGTVSLYPLTCRSSHPGA